METSLSTRWIALMKLLNTYPFNVIRDYIMPIEIFGSWLEVVVMVYNFTMYRYQPGRYRHYKGEDYTLLGIGRRSETGEEFAV